MKYNIHNVAGEILNLDGPLDCREVTALAEKIRREDGIGFNILDAWGKYRNVFLARGESFEFTHPGYTRSQAFESLEYWQIGREVSKLLRGDEFLVIGGVRYWGPGGITRIEDSRCGRKRFRLAGGDAA